jgi:hypothetical protein
MAFQREFNYCLILAVLAFLVYIVFSLIDRPSVLFLLSIFSIILGSSMVVLGFWGSDFAFAMAAKQLHQEKVKGKVSGERGKVYVPFMKNYTPLEWWNLNWFLTLIGVFFVAVGCLTLGSYFGSCILV